MSRCAKSAQRPRSGPGQLPGKLRRQRLRLTGCVLLVPVGVHICLEVCDMLVTVKQIIASSCRELVHCGQLSHRQQRDTNWMSLQRRKGLNARGGEPRMPGRPATLGSCRNSGTQIQALYGRTALWQQCFLLPLVWVRSSCEGLM